MDLCAGAVISVSEFFYRGRRFEGMTDTRNRSPRVHATIIGLRGIYPSYESGLETPGQVSVNQMSQEGPGAAAVLRNVE